MLAKVRKSRRPVTDSNAAPSASAPTKSALNAALARGEYALSLELAERLETLEPEDPRWPHKIGDLLRREGRVNEAAAAYRRAADRYARRGFDARAQAMTGLARLLAGHSGPLAPDHPSIIPEPRR